MMTTLRMSLSETRVRRGRKHVRREAFAVSGNAYVGPRPSAVRSSEAQRRCPRQTEALRRQLQVIGLAAFSCRAHLFRR